MANLKFLKFKIPVQATEKKIQKENKKILLKGLVFIMASFICIVGIFKFMIDLQREKSQEVEKLKEKLTQLNSERDIIERKVADLEQAVGTSIDLKKILFEAEKIYGSEEKSRKDGYLWVDRHSMNLIVTLGAIHGLSPGDLLSVYEGDNKIGLVRVEIPLDVISYVQPVNKSINQLEQDYYRVAIEQ